MKKMKFTFFKTFNLAKKVLSICCCLFIFIANLFCQDSEEVSQVVLPIEVYVGDQAEIRYTFRSAIDFFAGKENVDHLDLQNPFTELDSKFSVKKAELYQNGMEYTVRFVVVPWTVGIINFPSFNLNDALKTEKGDLIVQPKNNSESEDLQFENSSDENLDNSEKALFFVALYPIEVKSIVEKTGNNQIRPPVPPMIVPGTTYILFFLILIFIILLIFIFRILFKFNSIRRKWNLYLKKKAFKKNAEDAIKKIKRLLKNSKLTDIEFCSNLQFITRNYLEFRFDYRFTAISSTSIRGTFEKICAGSIPNEIAYAVENIAAMFVRTDYIRYAHDSIDSRLYPPSEHQAVLVKTERKSLSEMILKAIECFESEENNQEQSGE